MVKDTKYIIKRIIIGVGIALVLMLIKGGLLLDVQAQEVNATPQDIVLTQLNGSPVTYSPTSNTWNNQQVWALPSNISYDWPSGSSLYFRYPQNAGATYCSQYSNKATLSGRLYNASTSDIGSQLVKYEDTTSGGSMACSYTKTNNFLDFICNNVPSNHGFNIQLQNVVNGRWGIAGQLNFECIISGADISGSINAQSNQNTQNIINNNNQNTQNIINNNNENTDKIVKSMYTCTNYSYTTSAHLKNSFINSNGNINDTTGWGVSRYVPVYENTKILVTSLKNTTSTASVCFFNASRSRISCTRINQLSLSELNIPSDTAYVRFSLASDNRPSFQVCSLGNSSLNDTLTDTDIDGANNDFENYVNEFSINTHGLSDIVTAPLRLIEGLSGASCNGLRIPLPFVDEEVVLPCMSTIYTSSAIRPFFIVYRLITDGLISYWVVVNTFKKIKDFLNPTNDKVEVFNL